MSVTRQTVSRAINDVANAITRGESLSDAIGFLGAIVMDLEELQEGETGEGKTEQTKEPTPEKTP